jgi:hypothetical protein
MVPEQGLGRRAMPHPELEFDVFPVIVTLLEQVGKAEWLKIAIPSLPLLVTELLDEIWRFVTAVKYMPYQAWLVAVFEVTWCPAP